MNYNLLKNNMESTKLITVQEFASEYGIGMNKSYEIVNKDGFPKIKLGRKILIIRNEVDKFFIRNIGNEF
ncbi:helix-turn-helix domain-containing protein [Paraclostridium bifermentans]|uniref:helix-turn-helix domain-containing protein n=1 Tax=Paraclostridium bifermentans TaxID=1490 RepID=UPI001F1B4B1E|nr:helix-turn-helix domain-containing protein [Paraclostridium bifermentans]MCE9676019.1 helix-turn-helix domain-containing protein [Paraclostridium bifermentans]